MDDNVQRNGKNVVSDICDDSSNDDRNDEKWLDKLTDEEIYQMTFNMHEDGETFYNAYVKVNGFSIRNYNMHKDNAGIVKSRKCVALERSSGKYLVNNFVSVHNHPMIGPRGIPFLRSHRKRNIEVADGDAEGALAYLCAKAENDPLFYYKYDVDEQNRLNDLFWRDVTCRTDYMCFGDVLIFDSTYRTNAYRKPLVILVGVNSHFQTAIFGYTLLTAETVEAYTWVLERFLNSMDHKKPVSVMTDGDKAIRRAIKTVLPDVNHRLCKWHLKKNVVSNVHVPGFLADFEKCMSMSIEEEFEVAWKNLLDDYSLHQNKWAVDVYKKKTLWAEAYMRADTYTRDIFNKFLKEFKKKQSMFKVDKVELANFRVYYLSRYQQPDATWSVNYQPNDGIMKCSCLKFESIGFPCQHMISIMKMEHMREIPSCLIL
ncbi:protein FAR1-RELATED SEQUENCE 5-like [Rhododendron vialii]|uniref:protein FAR1-RELATED SEQUENCE 5-like n=1 Tax=Rhododendron vialii TaxID=182163 RepID=UPI00265F8534|nr:protein FAR1-RELATED SEQUENCE 5-like [Rhododendron vialii]